MESELGNLISSIKNCISNALASDKFKDMFCKLEFEIRDLQEKLDKSRSCANEWCKSSKHHEAEATALNDVIAGFKNNPYNVLLEDNQRLIREKKELTERIDVLNKTVVELGILTGVNGTIGVDIETLLAESKGEFNHDWLTVGAALYNDGDHNGSTTWCEWSKPFGRTPMACAEHWVSGAALFDSGGNL